MISKIECKKIINRILNKKRYNEYDEFKLELYIQIYLILIKQRRIAQIYIDKEYTLHSKSIYKKIIKELNNKYEYYRTGSDKNSYRIIVYSKKYEIEKLNKSYGKKYAKDLGEFYVCADDNLRDMYKKNKYLLRPVISVEYKDKLYVVLYAQMCHASMCIKNFKKFIEIKNKIKKQMEGINKKLNVKFELKKSFS